MRVEIRSEDCAVISGYVNAVERRSKVLRRPGAPPFREVVKSGTFRKALDRGNPVAMKLNHERTLCDTASGLELREDNVGLYATATITDRETVQAARDGKLTGWSFGFCCLSDNWRADEGGVELRELNDIRLDEVSILTKTPAYIATSVEVRDEELLEQRAAVDIAETIDHTPTPPKTPQVKPDLSIYRAVVGSRRNGVDSGVDRRQSTGCGLYGADRRRIGRT